MCKLIIQKNNQKESYNTKDNSMLFVNDTHSLSILATLTVTHSFARVNV